MALLALKVTTAVTPAGGSAAATTAVKSAAVSVAAPIPLGLYTIPPWVVSDTSSEVTSPVVPASAPRNRALRDFVSVLDFGTYTSANMDSVFLSAMNNAHTKGLANGTKFKLLVPPNVYKIGRIVPQSYVDIHAHGAVFSRDLVGLAADSSIFYGISTPVTDFAVRGATVVGVGTETQFQGFVFIINSTRLLFEDCYIHDTLGCGIYLRDCQNMRVRRNELVNVAAIVAGVNPINFVNSTSGNTIPLKYIWCDDNLVQQVLTIGICVSTSGVPNRTDPDHSAHITNNTVETTSSGTWCIAIEQGGTAPANVSGFDISGNTMVQNRSSGSSPYALAITNDSTPVSGSALCISDFTLRGNRIKSLGAGILCEGSHGSIVGNSINAATDDIVLAGPGYPSHTATIVDLAITGNVGHRGSGKEINILGGVDTTTLTSTNAQ